ncbi:MAG: hypothetical protein A2513_02845 [Sulfurimonas sp. RIFOXYD12_FULL_33_39]|uniref:hypothetical protein n=1 Tax=unclassified Sulfurimonas TaxID=2623549 RepID=UPI0008D85303|nr:MULTISPECIES: hypothetical protein [unclassified Sulfurimonas]OHE08939.1 MAG: hypothetical protein A2513_02845 [Sulfurimonas sp. RIFOXYD12_FULL_33_39]OHE14249.1 MAG: hypothetical protein A2530_06145 [Sulfurimonas sp. RIFOXYD2_FULL_34_21]DAB28012.1 MAG TPA: hypothetical protein CFH78_04925 [Sulfurimonas sp. UBA10385]
MQEIKDRKISNIELEQKGLIVNGVEIIPPIPEKTQSQKRTKREIEYFKLFGRIYYQESDLIKFAEKSKTNRKNEVA